MPTIWTNLINGETLPLSLNGSKISLTKITADLSNLKFDISEFYPLISEELLEKSISFAKNMTIIDDGTIQIIKHARKSLLIDNTSVWVKNDDNPLFDVTKGSFDSAEVCELVMCMWVNLGLTTIPDRLGTKCIQLILNFQITSGN